jgi:hypothetical protein
MSMTRTFPRRSATGCPATTGEGLREAPSPCGLIFGLIHLRSPAFTSVRMDELAQIADVNGIRRTVILTPENRKVGGSTIAW